MPKATRNRKVVAHSQSAKLSQRFSGNAAANAPPDSVDIGSMESSSAADIFTAIKAEAPTVPLNSHLKKKEKQQMKHQAFVERLQSAQSPYSRSHNRRLKRKEKHQLVAKMDDLDAALTALSGHPDSAAALDIPGVTSARKRDHATSKPSSQPGMIGEGKGSTLSKTQRKAVLKNEQARLAVIQNTKEYVQNPFELIRKHAQATLVPRARPDLLKDTE